MQSMAGGHLSARVLNGHALDGGHVVLDGTAPGGCFWGRGFASEVIALVVVTLAGAFLSNRRKGLQKKVRWMTRAH